MKNLSLAFFAFTIVLALSVSSCKKDIPVIEELGYLDTIINTEIIIQFQNIGS